MEPELIQCIGQCTKKYEVIWQVPEVSLLLPRFLAWKWLLLPYDISNLKVGHLFIVNLLERKIYGSKVMINQEITVQFSNDRQIYKLLMTRFMSNFRKISKSINLKDECAQNKVLQIFSKCSNLIFYYVSIEAFSEYRFGKKNLFRIPKFFKNMVLVIDRQCSFQSLLKFQF